MPIRKSPCAAFISSCPQLEPTSSEWDCWRHSFLTHPCGLIGLYASVAARPALSVKLTRWLAGDAAGSFWNRCAFAHELAFADRAGCKLAREARRLVSWWRRAGCPAPWELPESIKRRLGKQAPFVDSACGVWPLVELCTALAAVAPEQELDRGPRGEVLIRAEIPASANLRPTVRQLRALLAGDRIAVPV